MMMDAKTVTVLLSNKKKLLMFILYEIHMQLPAMRKPMNHGLMSAVDLVRYVCHTWGALYTRFRTLATTKNTFMVSLTCGSSNVNCMLRMQ